MSNYFFTTDYLVKSNSISINLDALGIMSKRRDKTEEITEWVRNYNDDLFRFAMRKMPDENLAADVVQNTFLAALTSYDNFKGQSSPKTWLMSILKNKIMDHYRVVYRKKEVSLQTDYDLFDDAGNWLKKEIPAVWDDKNVLDDLEFRAVLENCLSNLPEQWNTAIQMKYLDSKLTPESVGITRVNYWKMLERARRQLRTCLEKNWFNEET